MPVDACKNFISSSGDVILAGAAAPEELPDPAAAPPPPGPPPGPPEPAVGVARERRPKTTKEIVFAVPGLGDLRWNANARTMTAHCCNRNHQNCRKERTCQEGKTPLQGRPIGFLVRWLQEQDGHPSTHDHVHQHRAHTSQSARQTAWEYFYSLEGGVDFATKYERPRAADEPEEPASFRR